MKTTRRSTTTTSIWTAVVAALFFSSLAGAQSVVVPNSLTTVEGNVENGFPFNLNQHAINSQRYQQVYAASQFATLGGPALITQIAFRPDYEFGVAFASNLSSIQINLSTVSASADGLSTTFASNVGANDKVVFGPGPLSLSSAFTGPASGPKNFDILINLTNPFVFNPANGNLLLDVRNFSAGPSIQFDAHLSGVDSVSRVVTRLASGVNDAAGFADSVGLVTRFQYVPIPEPTCAALAATGFMIVLGSARRRRAPTV